MQDVFQRPRLRDRGVVVMDARNVSHLVAFWNLRACGQEVFPWAEDHADLLEEPLRQWLDEVTSGRQGFRPAAWPVRVASAREPPTPCAPAQPAGSDGDRFRLMPQPHYVDPHACGPLMTSHVRRFAADTGQAGDAVIPLPVLDFLPRRTSWTDLGMVAADIEVWSEPPDPAGDRDRRPGRPLHRPSPASYMPFTRPRARGRVIPVRVSDGDRFPGAGPRGLASPETGVRCGICAYGHGERSPGAPSHPPAGRRHRRQPRQPARRPGSHPPGTPQPLRRERRIPRGRPARTTAAGRQSPLGRRGYKDYAASSRHAGRAGHSPAAGLPHLPAMREHDPRHPRRARRARPVRAVHCPGPLRYLHRQQPAASRYVGHDGNAGTG